MSEYEELLLVFRRDALVAARELTKMAKSQSADPSTKKLAQYVADLYISLTGLLGKRNPRY
jgi:hypothetical protein